MPIDSPPTSKSHAAKRQRQASPDRGDSPPSIASAAGGGPSPASDSAAHDGGKVGQSSNFRSVSACTRCRHRKNRCDQRLPSCASCEKAGVPCIGYDPITKKEIPRSYVFYLESRIEQLEGLLAANSIPFPPAADLGYCSKPGQDPQALKSPTDARSAPKDVLDAAARPQQHHDEDDETGRVKTLASRTGMSRVPEASNPRYLGSTTGISFAKVVLAAVQSSVSDQRSLSDKGGIKPYKPPMGLGGTSMRDSFFGLHTKPTIHPAAFPDKRLALKLVNLYFEHANPQIPVLHKHIFMRMFEQAYASEGRVRGAKELYMLNMVFAIGSGIFVGDAAKHATGEAPGTRYYQPEEYHASAIVHLEACLNNSGGGVEELQAVLLLANFALIKPVPPGLWYIIGVAVRLAIDLGLHYEDGKDLDAGLHEVLPEAKDHFLRERGRREYVRDLRRRLWWCTYSLDRLVSVCVGRPLGFSDLVMTTEFPSLLEDHYITTTGFTKSMQPPLEPTYKLVAHHYFRLRLLQSEILQVLQYQQAQIARANGRNRQDHFLHPKLPSPFLSKFDSFRSWRVDIDKRLWKWKLAAPSKQETGVAFSVEFLDLNYWQAIILLYRQSLSVPAVFEGEYNTSTEFNSPSVHSIEPLEDEDRVYLKVAEAGQKILRLYRQQHLLGLVNYTYFATHQIFTAGISYLYAIWHSPVVRSRLTMDEVDFTVLAAISVFNDFIERCPPAEACKDAFDRTAKATIKMANATGGFGPLGVEQQQQQQHDFPRQAGDSSSNVPYPHPRHHRRKSDHSSHRASLSTTASDAFSAATSAAPSSQVSSSIPHHATQYRVLKSDPDLSYPTTMLRNPAAPPPAAPLSNASSSEVAVTPEGLSSASMPMKPSPQLGMQLHGIPPASGPQMTGSSPLTTQAVATASYLSQQQQQQQQQQQAPLFAPNAAGGMVDPGAAAAAAALTFADFQGMDWLQGFGMPGAGGLPGNGSGGGDGMLLDAPPMDFGLGLGWEGTHHDFSEGQNLDIFDGYFFGGQQSGAAGAAGEGAGGMEGM